MSAAAGEFGLIARHFRPLAAAAGLDLADDAAVLAPPPGRELVLSADAMVAGVHCLPDDPPALIARKLLRCNLSDLAAMAATPLGYLLTIALPRRTPEAWVGEFASGLAEDQARFNIALFGGDTVSTPGPLSLSATVLGHVAPGQALRRAGAAAGDELWVTGTIGDGALGLLALRGAVDDPSGHLVERYRLPRPRLGLALAGIASAGMDVSDGLIQDCGHLCRASGLAATIEAALVPLSEPARLAQRLTVCLTGGDDYELLLAVSPHRAQALSRVCAASDVSVTRIGRLAEGAGVVVRDVSGGVLEMPPGWDHFPTGS